MPRRRKKVLFGAWLGKKYLDNPKYLLSYLVREKLNFDYVWIGDSCVESSIPPEMPVRFVCRGSLAAYWEMVTAGTCFVTHGLGDLGSVNLLRGASRIYLGHGLAIKYMGIRDIPVANCLFRALRRLARNVYRYDHYIASSSAHREKLLIKNATFCLSRLSNAGNQGLIFFLATRGFKRKICFVRAFFAIMGYLFRPRSSPICRLFGTRKRWHFPS